MRRRRRAGLGGLLVALVALVVLGRGRLPWLAPASPAPTTFGEATAAAGRVGPYDVLRVVDGDTLHVRIPTSPTPDERVRLLRINTPERGDPGYERATACLLGLVGGRGVELEWEKPGAPERDEYGRLLAYVWVDAAPVAAAPAAEPRTSMLVNEELVRQGYSRHFTKYGAGRLAERFRAAEEAARGAKRGLWTDEGWNVGARATRAKTKSR